MGGAEPWIRGNAGAMSPAPGAVRVLADLVAPQRCVGCGCPGERFCARCWATIERRPIRRVLVDDRGPLEVWAGANYAGVVRSAMLDFKRYGGKAIGMVLARCGARALAVWACSVPRGQALAVVPIHSGVATRRNAGIDVSGFMARAGCACVSPGAPPIRLADLLSRPSPSARSQKALGSGERFRNVHASMRVRRDRIGPGHHLLFDDVVTTGASLLEARRMLAVAGVVVRGAACVALVPTPHSAIQVESPQARDPPVRSDRLATSVGPWHPPGSVVARRYDRKVRRRKPMPAAGEAAHVRIDAMSPDRSPI